MTGRCGFERCHGYRPRIANHTILRPKTVDRSPTATSTLRPRTSRVDTSPFPSLRLFRRWVRTSTDEWIRIVQQSMPAVAIGHRPAIFTSLPNKGRQPDAWRQAMGRGELVANLPLIERRATLRHIAAKAAPFCRR